jgi:hypothetical protein
MKVLAMDVLAYETFIVCASGRDQWGRKSDWIGWA